MLKLSVCLIIFCLLAGCTNGIFVPNNNLIKQAIALELNQTGQQLTQQLDLDFQGFEINHLRVTQREPLQIQKLKTYHLAGTYDLKFNLPKRQIVQNRKHFDTYLQSQTEEKTWRVLIPDSKDNKIKTVWRSYLLK
ncbi:MAG: hypothetical protein ACFB02_02290 [Mastigocoleus sp.]